MTTNKSFSDSLQKLRSLLPRQIKEHEVLRIQAESISPGGESLIQKEVLRWAQRRTSGRLPEEAWQGQSFQHLSSGRTCMGVKAQTETVDLWALRIDDPDKETPGRVWSTEIVLGRRQGNEGLLLSLRLLVTTPEDRLSIEPHVPGLVLQLIGKTKLTASGYPLSDQPLYVRTEMDVRELIDELIDQNRSMPVIALSVPADAHDSERPVVDAVTLARATAGLARVFVLPARFTWALSERFGRRLSVFEGAARVYLPGFSADSNPFGGHDLFLPKDISDVGESAEILSRLRWNVARASVRRLMLGKNVLSFAMVRNLSLQRRQQELIQTGASEQEQLKAAEQRIVALEEQLEQALFESDEFAQLHDHAEERADTAETQLRSAGFRVQQLLEQIRAKGEVPDTNIKYPNAWTDFAEWCDINLAARVALAPQARRSLKNAEYGDIVMAAKSLLWLANDLREAKTQGTDGSLRDAQVLPGIMNAHCGSDQFEIDWQGEKRLVDWHIKTGGNTRDPVRCLRIYYFWDEASQQSVVGHLPGHRRTDAS